jgi:excisionase family DNA binding protein
MIRQSLPDVATSVMSRPQPRIQSASAASTASGQHVRHAVPSLVSSVPRAAKQMGVSELTVRRHVRDGRLRAVLVGGTWRIPRADATPLHLPAECSIRQVANSLEVSEVTVRRWIHSGDIPATKTGKYWRVPRQFLEVLLGCEATESDSPSAS